MRGRARPPSSPESEESWIVDCPCGVSYDDGEEMVDCDECGVWVHTSCCHILRGHTSYVCDKCKFKKKKKESEESEVAQLLVELPSKTPPLEEKVFTLRTELSREERAHVQGIPGGDPSFFVGVSPVFSRQLWKYTGYVPKVFQVNYNELPEEKAGVCVLFADCAETISDCPALECMKSDHQIEEGKPLKTEMQEAHADKYYLSKDKYSKRELRKESKHRHRLQEEDGTRDHYHSKRRRDENSKKDFMGKKRSKNVMVDDDYHGIPKSSRIASRNPKPYAAYNSVEDVDGFTATAYNNSSKVDELGGHGPQSLGFNLGEAAVASNSLFPKHVTTTKAAHKVVPVFSSRNEREGSNGSHRLADNVSHQETHFVRRDHEGAARSKFVASKSNTSPSGDMPKLKDQFNFSGHTDGKGALVGYSHSTPADPKEAPQRMRLNVLVSSKDQVEEITNEEFSPGPVNEKTSQEHLLTPVRQGVSLQPGKHHGSENVSFASRQQSLSQKQSEMVVDLAMTIQPICEGHDLSANVSNDNEHPSSVGVTNELHADDSLLVSTDQPNDQYLQDELVRAKRQDLALLTTSSPVQQVLPQDANAASSLGTSVSGGAIGNSHVVVHDDMKASPRSAQTGPSRSADMSSPTLSGPGVDSKQHGFTKVDSVSPPSERTLNVGLAQPVPSSKAYMVSPAISNNKAYTSAVVSKSGNTSANVHVKSNSSSKHRSRTDTKKADATAVTLEDLNETLTNSSLRKDLKELSRTSESKLAGTGKCLAAARVALHPKQSSHTSATKHMGQLPSNVDACAQANTQEQSLLQSRHSSRPLPTSMPHKSEKAGLVAGSKSTTVLLSPSHASTLDLHMQGMDSTRPVMNDEELALLLHQELNSSPRVARVARVRQGGTGPHPFSAKRPAMATTSVASTANQKDPHLIFRRKNRDESHGVDDDATKVEVSGGSAKQDVGSTPHSRKDKDTTDACKARMLSPAMTVADLTRHLSPGSGVVATERQLHSDSLGANDADDGERRIATDGIVTLPGLIEEILNEKGPNASYDYICEEVLPHWSKLRKHNGERYAYTSHRQAVLDCLRNRSAWSHLIDRGPKTNLGRKRRRLESSVDTESEHAEQISHFQDGGKDHVPGKSSKESEIDGSENWPLSDSNKDADLSLPEEVPKGKRKARRGRRLTTQSKGYGARAHHGKGERVDESAQGVEDDLDYMVSPFSEEPASTSEDDETFVHRSAGRNISRHRGSSVDSEDDDVDL